METRNGKKAYCTLEIQDLDFRSADLKERVWRNREAQAEKFLLQPLLAPHQTHRRRVVWRGQARVLLYPQRHL